MARQHSPGLTKRKGIWHIDKRIRGYGRLSESTGTGDLQEAERYLERRIRQIREHIIYGNVPEKTFADAAARYIEESELTGSISERNIDALDNVVPYVGNLYLSQIHTETLRPYLEARRADGVSPSTINREIGVIRRILMLAARAWRDENGHPWLKALPLLPRLDEKPKRPYVLTWEEQDRLFDELPPHLRRAATIAVNCGAREQELFGLMWRWAVERDHENRAYILFVLPSEVTKTKAERVLVPNKDAQTVLRELRDGGGEYVVTYEGERMHGVHPATWKKAWTRAGLPTTNEWLRGWHNLRHTYGHRLRAAGVSFELRQDLLGHRSIRGVTTHYSETEISALIAASDAALTARQAQPLRILTSPSRKTPAAENGN